MRLVSLRNNLEDVNTVTYLVIHGGYTPVPHVNDVVESIESSY